MRVTEADIRRQILLTDTTRTKDKAGWSVCTFCNCISTACVEMLLWEVSTMRIVRHVVSLSYVRYVYMCACTSSVYMEKRDSIAVCFFIFFILFCLIHRRRTAAQDRRWEDSEYTGGRMYCILLKVEIETERHRGWIHQRQFFLRQCYTKKKNVTKKRPSCTGANKIDKFGQKRFAAMFFSFVCYNSTREEK